MSCCIWINAQTRELGICLRIPLFPAPLIKVTVMGWFLSSTMRLLTRTFHYLGVLAWGCDGGLTLEQIIEWNQGKLDKDFILGFHQDVSHDYRQIRLRIEPFSECRLILSNDEHDFSFKCIVPETEITSDNIDPLAHACSRVWSTLPVLAIQSYGEIGGPVGADAIKKGKPPSATLFAMIDCDVKEHGYRSSYHVEQLPRGYRLTRRTLHRSF